MSYVTKQEESRFFLLFLDPDPEPDPDLWLMDLDPDLRNTDNF